MAVMSQVVAPQRVYVQMETTNKSFIDMHYYLKRIGIKNNNFFLILYDEGLAGVDPRDPNLSPMMKQRVLRECVVNYWYFLREVVRVPGEGGTVNGGNRYQLNRGNLAMNFLFTLNYSMFVELPRQFGKTIGAVCRYLWVYNFGTSNSEIMFAHKDHTGSKNNLKKLKEIREALPSYLQMSSAIAMDGSKLKVPDTVVMIQHPLNNNKIVTVASARSKDAADKLGRGATEPIQYYDEFAFMPFNQYAYLAAGPAYSKASANAKANGAPHGILITTTPGDLTNDSGVFAYSLRNNATPFNELYYDYTYEQLEELRKANTKSPLFHVRFTYQQLGRGMDYFNEMCTLLNNDWPTIRREVLLEWSNRSDACPFSKEDLDIIESYCHDPIRTILFGRAGQYQMLIYEDIDLSNPPIVGVDVSGAMYQDSSAITIIDSKTTKVCATLNCNYIPADDLADIIYELATKYMPNCVINIERNGGFGSNVISRLVKTKAKKNLYYEIKDRVIEESFNGYRMGKTKKLVKVYGTDSTKDVRARMIEILYDRVNHHKDKFIAPILHNEMCNMEIKKNGKVEHSDTSHDDQVFSYLHALRPYYDCPNLIEFGIERGTLKTDEDEEIIEDGSISPMNSSKTESLDFDKESILDDNSELQRAIDYVNDASKYQDARSFYNSQYDFDQSVLEKIYNDNDDLREKHARRFNEVNRKNDRSHTVNIPDSIFMMDDNGNYYNEASNNTFNGNLYREFAKL